MEKNGGRPKKETTGFKNKKTTGFENKKPNVNENENDNDNVNVNANDNASDSRVGGLQKIITFYENNIALITPYSQEVLKDYLKDTPEELILLAMKKAVEADKRTIQYIKGILNNWAKKGIKTVLDAEKEDRKFKNKNTKEKDAWEEFLSE